MGGYTTLSTTGIQGFSGICLAPDGSGFIAASDRGGVYKVSFSGEATPLYVETDGFGLDCEGVTLDSATGDVYLVLEREKQEVRMGDGTLMVGNQANPCLLLRITLVPRLCGYWYTGYQSLTKTPSEDYPKVFL